MSRPKLPADPEIKMKLSEYCCTVVEQSPDHSHQMRLYTSLVSNAAYIASESTLDIEGFMEREWTC